MKVWIKRYLLRCIMCMIVEFYSPKNINQETFNKQPNELRPKSDKKQVDRWNWLSPPLLQQ